ncbi:MAG: PQQ-binding-like beta-propeller repeat protein [Sandaracinaceae bacterium]
MGPTFSRFPRGLAAICLALSVISCGGDSTEGTTTARSANSDEARGSTTTGDEIVPPPAVADLTGAAAAPPEPEIPEDTIALGSRMAPKALDIPNGRGTNHFTFDGFHRGWRVRPTGQQLLTPIYGQGRVYVGGGFGSNQVYAFDARTGEREWVASAPDGGPPAAILEDDKILFNTESCTLFAVDVRTGRQRWSRWLGDPLMSQPTAANGLVFSGHILDNQSPGGLEVGTTGWGTGEGRRYGFTALNLSNGQPRWSRPIDGDVMNAAVVDGNDVYVTTMRGTVYRMNQRTGRVHWRRPIHATSAPFIDGDSVHVTVRRRENGEIQERAVVLAKGNGHTEEEFDPVSARFVAGAPDPGVQQGWAYEGSRATVVDGRIYQTIGNEVHCRDARTHELLWRRRYTNETHARPASPPAIAGSQLVFGTEAGTIFGLDIDTGMTAWAYDVGEPISAQPTAAHGWVYATTTRGSVLGLEVSDATFDGWHMWGGNAAHNGAVENDTATPEEDERPTEGTMRLEEDARRGETAGFPLQRTTVNANVSGFVARVRVEQTFHNPYERPVEAVYLFPLPDDAAVDSMEMRAGDRVIRANIRRRHVAQEEYRQARDEGLLASLLEQERPNLFRQSVANIRPGDEIRVALTYTQALPYEEGSYRFVYPMVAGPRYQPSPDGDTAPPADGTQQVVLAPGGERPDRVEVTIDADLGTEVRRVSSPTHSIEVTRPNDHAHHVALSGPARPDRDLDVRFQVAGEAPTVSVLASPPSADARGNFAVAIHPRMDVPDDQVMPRELVFVVDTSSSMIGRPMELAQQAMRRALRGLSPTDTFRVLSFSDTTSALSEDALPATPENIERGVSFVDGMRALGATEMLRGVRAALRPTTEDGRMRIVLLMTDGFIGNETQIFRAVHEDLGQSRVFAFGVGSAVNRYLLSRLSEIGRGDLQVVTLDESPQAAADRFHERIARPYLTDVSIDWGGLEVTDAYPRRVPDLYADRPLVVHARYARGATGDVTIRGRIAGRPFEQVVSVALPQTGDAREELRSVWARTRIRDLMTAMALQPNEQLQEEVTQLGLEHHLLTQWTAFVAIDPGYQVAQPADVTVNEPAQLPAGQGAEQNGVGTTATSGSLTSATPSAPTAMPAADAPAPAYFQAEAQPAPTARRMRMAAPSEPLGAMGYGRGGGGVGEGTIGLGNVGTIGRGASGGSGSGYGAATDRERGDEVAGPRTTGHRENCYDLARRPDGSIDQAILQDCLRRQAAGGAPKMARRDKRGAPRGPLPGRAATAAAVAAPPERR